jgi:hypothetical protein
MFTLLVATILVHSTIDAELDQLDHLCAKITSMSNSIFAGRCLSLLPVSLISLCRSIARFLTGLKI